MRFLTSQEIIEINKKVIFDHGGLHGVRDINLLESAIANPQNLFCYKNSNIYDINWINDYLICFSDLTSIYIHDLNKVLFN